MAKFKVCPSCGAENEPGSLSCIQCDMDLSGVKITDTDVPQTEPVPEGEPDAAAQEMVKVCECGEINPAQARKCQACGEDISDVIPVPTPQTATIEASYMLSQVGGDYHFRVPCSGAVIGREQGMRECLGSRQFVSRVHARLSVENGVLFIENLSSTNFTYVNNVRIPEGKTKLEAGDEIGLGGISVNGSRQDGAAYFIVGLSV